jgi:site-specific DNA recombinase
MEKQYFSYTRVSTAKQGEHGVSLSEQKEAIFRYAQKNGLRISRSFEEQETAARRGRPIFSTMLRLLKIGRARGVIIHKIDRSARNLRDWADLGELIDAGLEVHFANESLDLNTRGGRLSADIQAVVASDYIRNLREETRKGFYGRLKQGLYPLGAPIGYEDRGSGKAKEIDARTGPRVRQAFELYATGTYSLPRLTEEMHARGLRNRRGGRVSVNGLSTMLNNTFYLGLIRIKKTGEVFPGVHAPLVRKHVFDNVQRILEGKTVLRATTHDFTFRRLARCAACRYALIGERQKGHVYYRCHTRACDPNCVREEMIEDAMTKALMSLRLDHEEIAHIREWIERHRANQASRRVSEIANIRLQLNQVADRIGRLTDAYIDGVLDKNLLEERRYKLLQTQAGLKERLLRLETGQDDSLARLDEFLELIKSASNLYKMALSEEKRDFVKKLTSNLTVDHKNVMVTLKNAAQVISSRDNFTCSSPDRGVHRTWEPILNQLVEHFKNEPAPVN